MKEPQVLPHSEESERAVLGAILLDNSALGLVAARLEIEDWYYERHQWLFAAMLDLREQGIPIDHRTLQALLEQRGQFERIGGIAYLTGLDLDLPDIGRVETYAELVKERAVRRRIIRLCGQTVRQALDGGETAPKISSDLRIAATELLAAAAPTRLRRMADGLDELFDAMENPEARVEKLQGIRSGFPLWDALGNGFLKGCCYVIAGRPGMGKTSLALDVARHLALREGKRVALFSLEMSARELLLRLLSSETEIPEKRLRVGRISQREWTRLIEISNAVYGGAIWIDDSPGLTLRQLEARLRRQAAEHGIDLAVVDYLQLMEAGFRVENRRLEIAAISRAVKGLARELEIPILLLSQLNRENSRRTDPRPTLADLAESGAIEQDADQVAFVHRHEEYDPSPEYQGAAELLVRKHRQGETGTVNLVFIKEIHTFRPVRLQGPDPF